MMNTSPRDWDRWLHSNSHQPTYCAAVLRGAAATLERWAEEDASLPQDEATEYLRRAASLRKLAQL